METFRYAYSFQDLIVYQKAREIAREIFELSKTASSPESVGDRRLR